MRANEWDLSRGIDGMQGLVCALPREIPQLKWSPRLVKPLHGDAEKDETEAIGPDLPLHGDAEKDETEAIGPDFAGGRGLRP